jgi:hypothetical protein
VAVPHDSSESVRAETATAQCAGAPPATAADALVRLRSVLDNDELTERIPAELCQAGFARVFFTRAAGDESPRDQLDSSATLERTAHMTVPVFVWRKLEGHLHAATDPAVHEGNPTLLRLLAEGVGTIFERNVLAERLHTMNTSAREHAHEISLLSDGFSHPDIPGSGLAYGPGVD